MNEAFADAFGLVAGDTFSLRTVTPAALGGIVSGQADPLDPDGEDVTMTVAGVIRWPSDLRSSLDPLTADVGSDSWYLGVGPAFVDNALVAFALVTANAGMALLGQAIGRQVLVDVDGSE